MNNKHLIVCKSALIMNLSCLLLCFFFQSIFAEEKVDNPSDTPLLNQYIKTKGDSVIIFDSNNIKQFWIDNSVMAKDDLIVISLKHNNPLSQSNSFKIQLNNVREDQICSIDIFTKESGVTFDIKNKMDKLISKSSKNTEFLDYNIISSSIPLEDTLDFSFNITFFSPKDSISINKIVLSFSNNPSSKFLDSPGFVSLFNIINKKGTRIEKMDIKYLISENKKHIYILLTNDTYNLYPFFYHVYPSNATDFLPGREQHGFNNLDASFSKNNIILPKPYSFQSKYVIIQQDIPDYPYTLLRIGQFSGKDKIWTISLK